MLSVEVFVGSVYFFIHLSLCWFWQWMLAPGLYAVFHLHYTWQVHHRWMTCVSGLFITQTGSQLKISWRVFSERDVYRVQVCWCEGKEVCCWRLSPQHFKDFVRVVKPGQWGSERTMFYMYAYKACVNCQTTQKMHIMMQRILLMPDIAATDIVETTAGLLWYGIVFTFSSKPGCSLVIVLFV